MARPKTRARYPMTEQEAVERIRRTIAESGEAARHWAKRWRVSPAYLSDVLRGHRHLGPKLAKACGWRVRRVVEVVVDQVREVPRGR